MSPTATRRLSTAEERREAVLEAALPIFAAKGLHGTPTTAVAQAAGISHAYLFRLFPTKTELFLAASERVFARTRERFAAAAAAARAEGQSGEDVLHAMGAAYVELLADPTVLLGMLNAHAAATSEPAVRDAVRACFADLVGLVQRETGAPDEEVQRFFATGMLLNVLSAMRADEVDEPWARVLTAHHGDK
jgi:AcrR family transcriptional regulator